MVGLASRAAETRFGRIREPLERPELAELQRARILAAMFDVVSEHGARAVTVAHVAARSGVSRRTFYEMFSDREDCFLAAFQEGVSRAAERVLPAYESTGSWLARIRRALFALLCFLDWEPPVARLLICESHGGGQATLEYRARVLTQLTLVIEQGTKQDARTAPASSEVLAESVLGGVLTVIQSRLNSPDHKPLIELTGPLMSVIALPYLGTAVARRELARPVPIPAPGNGDTDGEAGGSSGPLNMVLTTPFRAAGMRLTYRTVRVLVAIAEHPGASNRQIGRAAEIKDQGQVSKLLARLGRADMVANTGLGPGQGSPNAWTLTPIGAQIANSIRTHTPHHTPESQGR